MRYQPSNWVTPHFIEWITGLELTKSNQYNVEQDRLKVNFIIIYTYIKNVKKMIAYSTFFIIIEPSTEL